MMQPHPATTLFPMMSDPELRELAEDIRQYGQQVPIVLHEGQVLDGRNRYEACKRADTLPLTVEWDGQGGSPVAYVLSMNVHRRHLTAGQKAAISAEALPMLAEEAKERQRLSQGRGKKGVAILPPGDFGKARGQAAELTGASPRYVQDAKTLRETAPEVFERVKAGELSIPRPSRKYAGSRPHPIKKPCNASWRRLVIPRALGRGLGSSGPTPRA